jgi:hypothetical protein
MPICCCRGPAGHLHAITGKRVLPSPVWDRHALPLPADDPRPNQIIFDANSSTWKSYAIRRLEAYARLRSYPDKWRNQLAGIQKQFRNPVRQGPGSTPPYRPLSSP